jgi:hypothetical protein
MNAPAAQGFHDLLAELAEPDAVTRDVGVGGGQSHEAPLRRIGVVAEQQVRGGQVEERQGVGLDDLAEVHEAPEPHGGFRDLDREEGVAGLGGGQEMADRTNATDSRRDRGHLPEGPPLAELLEPAKLGDVEARLHHVARVVQVEGDLGVAFDARDRVDDDALGHGFPIRTGACPKGRECGLHKARRGRTR